MAEGLRFAVCAFLEPQPLEAVYERGELPQHVTLIGPATTGASVGEVEAATEMALAQFGRFDAEVGEELLLGLEHDVAATELEDDGALAAAHRALVAALRGLGVRLEHPEYAGASFLPHVTVVEDGERLERGERLELDSVALLEDDGAWRIAAQFPLL